MKYAYYPGCFLHGTAREYDISTKAICKAIGIELVELEDWNCCGALEASSDKLLSTALSVRNIMLAAKQGLDLLVPCSICSSSLLRAEQVMKEKPELQQKIEELIGESCNASIKTRHLLSIINGDYGLERLAQHVKKPLRGIRVAPYYGCLLTRPASICESVDPEDPRIMENLIEALGGEYIDFPSKTKCCGGALLTGKEEIANQLSRNLLAEAKMLGANCIVVACPLCHTMLDSQQAKIEIQYSTKFGLPVLYFTQVIGLALGLDAREIGLDRHFVSPKAMEIKL